LMATSFVFSVISGGTRNGTTDEAHPKSVHESLL
jgi:hypothetical protein